MNATELTQNVTLLVTLCVVYRLASRRLDSRTFRGKVVFGLILGGVGILGMLSPWRLHPGVVFDGRSVLVSLAGVFGGFLTAVIAVVMTACYRLSMGGDGALIGCGVIVSSGLLGVIFHRITRNHPDRLTPLNLYLFGVVIHLLMLAWMLSLPGGEALKVLRAIALPVLLLLPLATMLVGWVLLDQEAQHAAEAGVRESECRLRAIVENSPALIFVKDLNGRYLEVNRRFEQEFALSRDAILDRTDLDIFPREQAEAFRAHDAVVLQQGKPLLFEEVARRRDGEHISIVSKFPLLDASGKAYALCGIATGITERKRAEEALREANATLQSIFDAAPVAVLRFDLEGRITHWSRGAERMFGWTPAEALGRVCPTVPEDDTVDFLEMIKRVVTLGPAHLVRIRQKKSGERIQARLHPAPLYNPDGKVGGVMVIMEDFTEQHRAEDALRQSEARLNNLIENALDAIISVDENHRIQIFNKGAEAIFGYPAAEVLGQPLERLWPDRFVEAHRQQLKEFARSPETARPMAAQRSTFGRRKDGSEFPIEASISKQITHDQMRFTGFLRDITQRLQAEERLRAAQNLLEKAFASMNEAVFIIHPEDRTIVRCNQAVGRIFGYTPEELTGRSTEVLHVNRTAFEEFARRSEPVLDEHGEFQSEYRMRRKDGTLICTEHTVIPLLDEKQWRFAVLSVVRDITERRRAEEALRQSEQQLRALSARLETLREEERARISREIHDELGQMLTGIRMDLRWMEDRLDDLGDHPGVNPILDKLLATAELTDATAQTVQRIAAELRPGVLDKLGLPMALQYEAAQFERRTGLPCRIALPSEEPALRL